MADINIKTSGKKVTNEKTTKQEKELEALKKQKEEADLKAKQAQKENEENRAKQKAEQEKKLAEQKAKEKNNEEVLNLAKSAISSVSKSKKVKGFIPGIIVGVIIGFVLSTLLGFGNMLTNEVNEGKESVDEVIDETFLGYTSLEFKNAVLGKIVEHQELIIMTQDVEVKTQITKAGLGNLEIFSKVKDVTYKGEGVFTVDLSKIDDEHIDVDDENKVVTISIPAPTLQYVNIDYDGTTFEDTEKGLLAFGDLALTVEDQNEINKAVEDAMRAELSSTVSSKDCLERAQTKTWELFNPLITAVSEEFTLEVVIK